MFFAHIILSSVLFYEITFVDPVWCLQNSPFVQYEQCYSEAWMLLMFDFKLLTQNLAAHIIFLNDTLIKIISWIYPQNLPFCLLNIYHFDTQLLLQLLVLFIPSVYP